MIVFAQMIRPFMDYLLRLTWDVHQIWPEIKSRLSWAACLALPQEQRGTDYGLQAADRASRYIAFPFCADCEGDVSASQPWLHLWLLKLSWIEIPVSAEYSDLFEWRVRRLCSHKADGCFLPPTPGNNIDAFTHSLHRNKGEMLRMARYLAQLIHW